MPRQSLNYSRVGATDGRKESLETLLPKIDIMFSELYGQSTPEALAAVQAAFGIRPFIPAMLDIIGDSRAFDATTANFSLSRQIGLTGSNFLNWGNALSGQRVRVGTNFGIFGMRTDEYLATNLTAMISSPAKIALIGYPCVNNLVPNAGGATSTFPYTHTNGQTVALADAGRVAFEDVRDAALRLVAVGKTVIVTCEPGATNLDAARVQQLHDFNARLITWARATPGVFCWSANSVLWNSTGSSTQIVMKTDILKPGDPTHHGIFGGYTAGKVFANIIRGLIPPNDIGIASINDAYGQNPRQLIRNPLFANTTGGTRSGGIGGTGNVPAGWDISGSSGVTANFTSAANIDGIGNDITVAISKSTAGFEVVNFNSVAPSNADWSLTDQIEHAFEIDKAAGSSNAHVYGNLQINAPGGQTGDTADWWSLWGNASFGTGPAEAYSVKHRSQRAGANPGAASKGYLSPQVQIALLGAGSSITFTIRRAECLKLS